MKSKWLTTISVTALGLGVSAGTTLAAGMDDLVAAAKKEGKLTTIALPHDWCGYGAVIDGFKAKYRSSTRQRAQSRRRLRRRGRGDQGQQGQHGPAGARRDRRRPLLRPLGQGRRPDPALQGRDLGHDPGQRQGRRRRLVRRLLRRAVLRGEQGHHQEVAGRLGRSARRRLQERASRSPAIRAPPTRRSRASMPPASLARAAMPRRRPTRASSSSPNSTRPGNFVPVIGKAASLAQGATPIVIAWDYNALSPAATR